MGDAPEHTGVRPLGPYGEGYCRVCCFVVGLTEGGLLEGHRRGDPILPVECKGSVRPPAKVTPYASRKAAFRVNPAKVACDECGQRVPTVWNQGVLVYEWHWLKTGPRCRCPRSMHAA